MIKMIIFDLGNVLLKDSKVINDEVGEKLSRISYECKFDSVFNHELERICKENHYDELFLTERLNNYFKERYKITLRNKNFKIYQFIINLE